MAKDNHDIDRLFRDKLRGHSVQPTPLAWDKLESRLSQKKKGAALWMRIAASLLLLGGLAALLWMSVESTRQELDILAEQEPLLESFPEESPVLPPTPEVAVQEETKKPAVVAPPVKQASPRTVKASLASSQPAEPDLVVKESISVPEVDTIELPPLDTDFLIAENISDRPEFTDSKEVVYKVTIISNGLREKPEKEGLVGEIENKIDKIGGLIGKVDQGFADLQDAKNNLFASITTKK